MLDSQQIIPKTPMGIFTPTTEFYAKVIDSLKDYSIFTLDNDLKISSWNTGSTKIFGYEPEEVIGQPFDIIFTEEDKKNQIPSIEIAKSIKDGRATDNRWHIVKDGSLFFAFGLVFPLVGTDGEKLGFVKILQDLTAQKNSEDAIKKYVKELEELHTHKESVIAILSHDLRSPLATIINTADYLRTNLDSMNHEEIKEFLDIIFKSSTNELATLDYLLEWARIKYASDIFSPAKVKLVEYIDNVFNSLKDTASINAINLHHEIEENTSVFADGKMLISVIQNIVSNAIKHTGQGGKVSITSTQMGDHIVVQVKDNGVGMSQEIQEKLFMPQVMDLANTRKENKGAGIGLLLVKGFLVKNGGKIWVESIEGQGSSFYFTLPLEGPSKTSPDLDIFQSDDNS